MDARTSSLVVLCLRDAHVAHVLCHVHEPDPQVVAHVRSPPDVGGVAPTDARHLAQETPQSAPRGPARHLFLHHHRLAKPPAGKAPLLVHLRESD